VRIGLFASSFDPFFHPGHAWAMRQACEGDPFSPCDKILACIHEDPSLERPEKRKPVLTIGERIEMLLAVRFVSAVRCYKTESDLRRIIEQERPCVLVLGEDHKGHPHTGHELGIPVFYARRYSDWSGTDFDRRIGERWQCRHAS
jgi:glycerol-3-phosphate cytidylyltransferase